jgi:MoaA/NifB/PqqE/SkfB family radical SAM enzyme
MTEATEATDAAPDASTEGRVGWLQGWRERRRFRSPRPRRGPALVQIGITDRCHYRCLMCTAHSPLVAGRFPPESERPQMERGIFDGLLRDLVHLGGTQQIDFVGIGEPLLHPDCLEMISAARGAGFRVGLATNGSLLTSERVQRLAALGVTKLHVSINSGSDEVYREVHPNAPPGARRRILDALLEMNAYCKREGIQRPRLALACVIFKLTYRDLPGLVASAAEVKATDVHFMPMGTTPETQHLALDPEEWQEAREIMRQADRQARRFGMTTNAPDLLALEQPGKCKEVYSRIPCYVGHEFSLIFADGQVRFCCGCDLTIENLNNRSFREVWRGGAYAQIRRQALALPRTKRAPAGCACFGACPHWRQNVATHERLLRPLRRPETIEE